MDLVSRAFSYLPHLLIAAALLLLGGLLAAFVRRSVLGELFVETYYAVDPAFAAAVDHSDPLRHAARSGLAPMIDLVRGLKYEEKP